MRIDIKTAQETDTEGMARLAKEVYSDTYKAFLPESVIDEKCRDGYFYDKISSSVADGHAMCVFVDMKLCGIITASRHKKPDTAEIDMLYIDKEMRRMRLGRKLLSKGLCTLRSIGYKRALLTAFNDNGNALRFYEKFGFKKIKTREADIGYGILVTEYEIEL